MIIAPNVDLPDSVLQQHLAILGKTGSGKTFTAKGIVEKLALVGRRICILDPTGVWWGLASSADASAGPFPVAIFGGRHGHVPITEHAGAALGELVAHQHLVSVIDLRDMLTSEQRRFTARFFESLYQHNASPLHLVVDEADEFGPQNPGRGGGGGKEENAAARCLGQFDRIARRGRTRGFRLMVITQRPAKLNKDILGQAATLISQQLILPHDRGAVKDWIADQADPAAGRELIATLPKLRCGEGWVWCPDAEILTRTTFPPITTFDSSSTPDDGQAGGEASPVTLADVDLTEVRAAMAAAIEEAADLYPTVFSNGLTGGWVDNTNLDGRNRNATNDPRLAGVQFIDGGSGTLDFRVDMPDGGGGGGAMPAGVLAALEEDDMLLHSIIKDSTDQSVLVMLRDAATGQGLTGLADDTSGLAVSYKRGGDGAATAVDLAALADAEDEHADGGFVEADAAAMPGVYRLDLPDAAVAAGADFLMISVTGASGLLGASFLVPLVDAIEVTDGKVAVRDGGISAAALADATLTNPKFQVRPYFLVAAVASGSGTTSIQVDDALHDGADVASMVDDAINGWKVRGVSGANKGRPAGVSDWVKSGRTMTVDTITAPADGDLFMLYKE